MVDAASRGAGSACESIGGLWLVTASCEVSGTSTLGLVPGEPAVGAGVLEESTPLVEAGED